MRNVLRRLSELFFVFVLAAGVAGAEKDSRVEVEGAIRALNERQNYSWISTTQSRGASPSSQQGATHGKTEKDGYTYFRFALDGNTVEAAFRENKSVIKTESEWQSPDELEGDSQWIGRRLKAFQAPAAEAQILLSRATSLKTDRGGVVAGVLPSPAVKESLSARMRSAVQFSISNDAKGSVKFWIKSGLVTKYEYNLRGRITLHDHNQRFDIDRTTSVEIRDVGTTKVEIPPAAKEKLY